MKTYRDIAHTAAQICEEGLRMILDEFIKELESPNIHRFTVDTNELLAFLKEWKEEMED